MSEIERLRKENEALNEQVKLLVRTEHQLHRSQHERLRQIRRIQALGDFALEISTLATPAEILGRALELLNDQFQLDQIVALHDDMDRDRVHMIEKGAGDSFDFGAMDTFPDGIDWVRGLSETVLVELQSGKVAPGLQKLLRSLGSHARPAPSCDIEGDVLMCMPLRLGSSHSLYGVVLACRHTQTEASYFKVGPEQDHVPYLRLMAAHLSRALHNSVLTSTLRERGQELASSNERLSASLKRLENTQQQLLQARKMEAVGRLAGGIAHDFNNLLTVILSHAELLREELVSESAETEDVSRIIEAGERAAQITSQLLAFSRRQSHRSEPIDLNAQVRATSRMLGRLIGEHIAIDLKLDARVPAVDADRAQLEQVILNLVINARDAMPEGGEVVISTRAGLASDAKALDGGDPREFVVLSVQDTGEGMDEETRSQVFEPFYTTKEHGRGTGLGLAMVYGVVKQSGGYISVTSAPGEGSKFELFFPVAAGEAVVAADPAEHELTGGEAGRILLVEDETSIRDVAARVLRANGYDVVEARDGAEAEERMRDEDLRIDLLITDVVMPRMGGARLASQLRKNSPHLPVLFMSGYTEEAFDSSILLDGHAHYLQKPFTPDVLLQHTRRVLRASEIDAAKH